MSVLNQLQIRKGSVAGIACIFFGWAILNMQCSTRIPEPRTPEQIERANQAEAFLYSQDFVVRRLATPATADFPWFAFNCRKLGRDTYRISSYVDSENTFGATVRLAYSCVMKKTTNEIWTCRDMNLRP